MNAFIRDMTAAVARLERDAGHRSVACANPRYSSGPVAGAHGGQRCDGKTDPRHSGRGTAVLGGWGHQMLRALTPSLRVHGVELQVFGIAVAGQRFPPARE